MAVVVVKLQRQMGRKGVRGSSVTFVVVVVAAGEKG